MSDKFQDGQFVGAVRAHRQVGGLTLAETEYRPGLVVASHAHTNALVSFVLKGSLTEERGRRSALCEQGSLIFHPPDESHGHRFHQEGGRCFVLQLGSTWTDRMRSVGLVSPDTPLDVRRTRANAIANQLYREFRSPDSAAALAIEGFALAMLGELARVRDRAGGGARPPWLIRAVDLLHARSADGVDMAEIASAVGIHPVHLSRTFHRHYGCTMGEYVRRLRVERARQELATTTAPLAEIGITAGFADQAHFSRVFKQIVGLTPGAYRKSVGMH